MKNVRVSMVVQLTDEDITRLFEQRLQELSGERWIDDAGHLMEERYTSHRFDHVVGGSEHPDYALVEAVQRLRQVLKERSGR